tara:strand:+ start:151 stop:678 length:528 start_codon:yes stop_codon:yes gene_type:complete
MNTSNILFVDLDGTLVREDTMFFLTKKLILKSPMIFMKILFKSKFEIQVYKALLAYESLNALVFYNFTFNFKVLDLMKKYKNQKRKVIIISGANEKIVNFFFKKFNFIDNYYGSNQFINLVGKNKIQLIEKIYPNESFDYVGNSGSDVPIWNESRICYSVKSMRFKGLKKNLKYI